jgi:hypothetical protein
MEVELEITPQQIEGEINAITAWQDKTDPFSPVFKDLWDKQEIILTFGGLRL